MNSACRFALKGGLMEMEDGDRVFCRGWRRGADGNRPRAGRASRRRASATRHPQSLGSRTRIGEELDGASAVRPLDLARESGR